MAKDEAKSVRIIGRAVSTPGSILSRSVGETPVGLYSSRVRIAPMRRLLALTCAIVLVDTIFYGTLTPLVPYFSEEFGLSKSAVGILSGAFGAGVLVGCAPGAYLASRAGVRAAAITGLVLMSVTSLAFGLAAFTWLTARAPDERRGELIGIMLSAAVFGALLGPVLGSAAAIVGLVPAFATVAIVGATIAL